MFESLTEKLTATLQRLTSKGRLTEKDIEEALGQVRRALLEADVNFRVARDFVAGIKERALGADVMESLTPGQQVVKVVQEELTSLLSGGDHRMTSASHPPTLVMLVGLQGSGKTTTVAKLALALRRQGHRSSWQLLTCAGPLPFNNWRSWAVSWTSRFIRRIPNRLLR